MLIKIGFVCIMVMELTPLERLDLYLGQRMPFQCLGEKARMKVNLERLLEYIVEASEAQYSSSEIKNVLIKYIPSRYSDMKHS